MKKYIDPTLPRMTLPMKMSRFFALLATIVVLVQIVLLANDSEGICYNDGCGIVDSLTTVPPIYFNIGGLLFFQAVFWGIWLGRVEHSRLGVVKAILLAGMAAEGVLVSYQHFVAQIFCSYCLLIFSFVVLLNILAGFRQILIGGLVFSSVLAGFAALQFGGVGAKSLQDIDSGTYAVLAGAEQEKRYLFFSSSCPYCEEVIESLQDGSDCAVRFNPIEEINEFALQNVDWQVPYQPSVNQTILRSFGIGHVPVLLVTSQSGFEVITGGAAIQHHMDQYCIPAATQSSIQQSIGVSQSPAMDFLPQLDESCTIDADCEDEPDMPPTEMSSAEILPEGE